MKKRSLPAFLLVAFLSGGPLGSLDAQQAPPMDPKAVLAALKDLRTKQVGIMNREKTDTLAAINAAMADPGKAYQQAIESVQLQGQTPVVKPGPAQPPGHGGPNHAMDVRKHEGEQVRDRDFVNGLRLQLVFLSLTWQRSMGVKAKDLVPALLDYVGQVNANFDTLSSLDMFRRPISDSVFVNYFQIGPYITGLPDWPDRAFDTEAIFQKTILPEMRKSKDPRLLSYWDTTLQTEAARVSATQNNLAVSRFNHIRRPTLLWSRAEDQLLLGNVNQAAADMLALIKANPDHPDFDKWASALEGIAGAKIDPPAGNVTVGPTTLVTPTPGVLPTAAPAATR